MQTTLHRLLLFLFTVSTLYAGGKTHIPPPASPVPVLEVTPPATNNFYIGVGMGGFELQSTFNEEQLSAKTAMLIAGYRLNRYFGVEARYSRGVEDVAFTSTASDKTLDATFYNIGLFAKASYPIQAFRPYLLLGYTQSTITHLPASDRKETDIAYGAGIDYSVSETVSLFADYTRLYSGKGFDGRSEADTLHLDQLTFGLHYHF